MLRAASLYLDNNATAPLRPEAASAMQAAMGPPSNPSSVHGYGRAARQIVEDARAEIAMLAGSRPADVVFTSGGTEANNLALSGFDHIITSAIEHDSVLLAAPNAVRVGVDSDGRLDVDELRAVLAGIDPATREKTILSVMMANNETGVIQPVDDVVALAKEAGIAVHCDMVQMLAKPIWIWLVVSIMRACLRINWWTNGCGGASGAAWPSHDKSASRWWAGAGTSLRH